MKITSGSLLLAVLSTVTIVEITAQQFLSPEQAYAAANNQQRPFPIPNNAIPIPFRNRQSRVNQPGPNQYNFIPHQHQQQHQQQQQQQQRIRPSLPIPSPTPNIFKEIEQQHNLIHHSSTPNIIQESKPITEENEEENRYTTLRENVDERIVQKQTLLTHLAPGHLGIEAAINQARAGGLHEIPPPHINQVLPTPIQFRPENRPVPRLRPQENRPAPPKLTKAIVRPQQPSANFDFRPQERYQQQERPRPVVNKEYERKDKKPVAQILRKYMTENPDGSITWGYENDDGSFKEETMGADCITRGKYGYVDPDGEKREYSYETGLPCDHKSEEEEEELAEQQEYKIPFNNPGLRRPKPQ